MSLPDHAYSHSIVNFLVDMFANPSSWNSHPKVIDPGWWCSHWIPLWGTTVMTQTWFSSQFYFRWNSIKSIKETTFVFFGNQINLKIISFSYSFMVRFQHTLTITLPFYIMNFYYSQTLSSISFSILNKQQKVLTLRIWVVLG
jgi:hypothetical protein